MADSKKTPQAGPGSRGLVQKLTAVALQFSLVRAFLRYASHKGPMLADSITYRALFSVFAAILLFFSAATIWIGGNSEALGAVTEALDSFLPGLTDLVDPEDARVPVGFTIVGVFSLVGLVGAAISSIGSMRNAFRMLGDVITDDTFVLWVVLRNLLVGLAFGGLLVAGAAASLLTSSGLSLVSAWSEANEASTALEVISRIVGVFLALAVNTLAIAIAFRLLSGVRAPARALWTGALAGGIGLLVLQEFSGLFVRGAASNPLLASFAALIALLLWINLSAQVILIAASLIITLTAEAEDRVREKFGAATMAQHRRLKAEAAVAAAAGELTAAREAEQKELVAAEAHRTGNRRTPASRPQEESR
ncbi:YihY/virulence factor BrkB family protein [Leucobacter sp. W1478]|uniref:YihY/virulence factor BrkB family protein n=1 Tax=Leucobacter sp. W1478 TaxID=3439065 RepID=UPI003F3A8E6C